jgi:hypothetical protein
VSRLAPSQARITSSPHTSATSIGMSARSQDSRMAIDTETLDPVRSRCKSRRMQLKGYGDRKVEPRTVSLLSCGAMAEMAGDDRGSEETTVATLVARASTCENKSLRVR